MALSTQGQDTFSGDQEKTASSNRAVQSSPENRSDTGLKLQYLQGWRLYVTTLGLFLSLFMVNIEVTIVSTSSLAIANDLQGYNKLGWILTGYLITYTGFIIPWAKSSDIFGCKTCILSSLTFFIIFSGGCGAAQTVTQLIVCRVFQGIGAAGGFGLVLRFANGMVPKSKLPLMSSIFAVAIALANLAGPLVGGALSEPGTWRWVFLLNVPVGAFTVLLLLVAVPSGFPYHSNDSSKTVVVRVRENNFFAKTKRLDMLGAGLLLAAALLLTTGLLEGGVQWEWKSAPSIVILIISGILWIAFFWWERLVALKEEWKQEPMFPWRFLDNRQWMGVLLSSLLNGLPFYIVVISVPQRLQTVNGESPVATGVKLLPYTLVAAVGSIMATTAAGPGKVPPIYVMWFFSALATIGTGLMTTLPSSEVIEKSMYGYLALAGLGIGGTWGLVILLVGYVVEERDVATGSGALVEFRILGGAFGIAIMTAALENYLHNHLGPIVTSEQLSLLLQNTSVINELSMDLRAAVLRVFADGYTMQMKIATGFSAAQFLAVTMMWKKPQITLVVKDASEKEESG